MAILHSGIIPYKYKYQAAASNNVVVKASQGFLHAIVVGVGISGGTIGVSDHATLGDGSIKLYLSGGTVEGNHRAIGPETYIVDAEFPTGITADQYTQTKVTYIYY